MSHGKETNQLHMDKMKIIRPGYLMIILAVIIVFLSLTVQNGWWPHAKDWMSLILRWGHIIYGIAWIGASFYFIFLENSLEEQKNRPELKGTLWALHGGGFYYLEKFKAAPKTLPRILHWFKWDAYLTWVTGFLLMAVLYYSDPKTMLLPPGSTLDPTLAVVISVSILVLGWFTYVGLSMTPLLYNRPAFATLGFALVILVSYGVSQIFSDRGAFLQIGALLGTIMAGNVFFVIIPSQKRLVKAAQEGKTVDPQLGNYAQNRSLHNNYITLPVLFTMISNHYPMTYGAEWNWVILAVLFVAGFLIRHFINVTERGQEMGWLLPLAAVALLGLFYFTAPKKVSAEAVANAPAFSEIQPIMQARCASCHVGATAPKGVALDTRESIVGHAAMIKQTVESKYMPMGNVTNMTDQEREKVIAWVNAGAKP